MKTKPLFAFFGTPDISVYVLDALERAGYLPALVVTAPDRPRGRGMETTPTPVKQWAQARDIDVITPAKLSDPDVLEILGNTDWDVFIVAMYAKLIPKTILDMPRRGVLNVHPSLLPKFRGPSPVLSAILADERATGVCVMQLVEAMDAGSVVAQARIELEEDMWPPKGSEFETLLATEGGNLLAEVLPDWVAGKIDAVPQDDTLATYTKKFTDEDALLDAQQVGQSIQFDGDARTNLCKIRAFDKSPRAHFYITKNGKPSRVTITEAHIEGDALVLDRVIPEGKKEMAYADFARGLSK